MCAELRKAPFTVTPAPAEAAVAALLTVASAQQQPLQAGDRWALPAGPEEFLLIAAAEGRLTASAGGYLILEPGQALCRTGPCEVQAVTDGLCAALRLRGELPRKLLGDLLEGGMALFPQGAAAVRGAILPLAVLEREHGVVDGETASSRAYSLLLKLRLSPTETGPELPPLVNSAIAIIQEEFPYLAGLDDLAERLEVSKAHLSRSFMKRTGVTPGRYLLRVRVEYAKLLLRDEGTTVAYAAAASGFANANYFAKVFRRETGMSPTEYMASHPQRRPPSKSRGPGDW